MLPNQKVDDAVVVASVIYNDNDLPVMWTVLLLYPEPPYFGVVMVEAHSDGQRYVIDRAERELNIVPAVETYQQWGGDY